MADSTVCPMKGKKVKDRDQWANKMEFFLSCLSYAVGLSNIWRFSYLCYRNGGGAFLIPYLIMLAVCGLPLFYAELAISQYHGQGPNIIFKHLCPAFQGVGYASLVVSSLVAIYYNLILAWTIFYLVSSFSSQLGWASCDQPWNTPNCYVLSESSNRCLQQNAENGTSNNVASCILGEELTSLSSNMTDRVSASEEFYLHHMLGISSSVEEAGQLRWQLVLYLFLAWLIVALCLIKGIRSSGKVVYFTALFPYVVLVMLLIRGVTLDGAAEGILFYLTPKWDQITHAQAWCDAASQLFYSLGIGFGNLITLGSYNKFDNNCYRDAVSVATLNCATSVFAGFVVFSIMGFMAHSSGVDIEHVIKSGPGLAFIAYPEAVTKMALSQLWAAFFFLMLLTIGLGTQFAMCETVITAIRDQWPRIRNHNSALVFGTCFVGFMLGIPLCAENGIYLFTLIDSYSAGWSVLIIGLLETVLVSWIYGVENFKKNIVEMIGCSPNAYWAICWKFLSPITIVILLVWSFANYLPASFGDYILPLWANALGWLMFLASFVMIPIFGIYELKATFKRGLNLKSAFKPTEEWGPARTYKKIVNDQEPDDVGTVAELNHISVK